MRVLPQLKINQSLGQIGIDKVPGKLKIEQKEPSLKIDYGTDKTGKILGDIKIENPEATLSIDQSKCREEYGFYKVNPLIKHMKNTAEKKTNEAMKEIANEGDYLSKIENNHKMAELAQKEMEEKNKKFKIGLIPESKPEINVETKAIKVNINKNKIKVNANSQFISFAYEKGKLDIYMKEKGYLEIEVIGAEIDMKA